MKDSVSNFNNLIIEKTTLWNYLRQINKHIILYGMGDGAVKIMNALKKYNISINGVFASDEFVRGHSFCGYKVKKLSEIEESINDFIVLVCFGTNLDEVINHIKWIGGKHELYAPDIPVSGDDLFTYEYYLEHKEELAAAYDMLADDKSKQVLINTINYKISGKLSYLFDCETDKSEVWKTLMPANNKESYLDLGAYDGDTVKEFLNHTQNYNHIIAVEPDKRNFKKLTKNIQNAELHNVGVWNEDTELEFIIQASRNSSIKIDSSIKSNIKERPKITVKTIDSLANGREITYIKMDVEGSEFEAIQGGRQTISNRKPKMNIAAYHRNSDLYKLPELIKSIDQNYKIYLRHHKYIPAWETNFYVL